MKVYKSAIPVQITQFAIMEICNAFKIISEKNISALNFQKLENGEILF